MSAGPVTSLAPESQGTRESDATYRPHLDGLRQAYLEVSDVICALMWFRYFSLAFDGFGLCILGRIPRNVETSPRKPISQPKRRRSNNCQADNKQNSDGSVVGMVHVEEVQDEIHNDS